MYIIDSGTASKRNITAIWEAVTTDPEVFPEGKDLKITLFMSVSCQIKKVIGVMEIIDFIHGEGQCVLYGETGIEITHFPVGVLCCMSPTTWAHTAIDLIDNL